MQFFPSAGGHTKSVIFDIISIPVNLEFIQRPFAKKTTHIDIGIEELIGIYFFPLHMLYTFLTLKYFTLGKSMLSSYA